MTDLAAADRTWRLGLLGRDIARSRSPALHRAALQAYGLPGDYALFDCADDAAAADLVARLRAGELDGLNVTTPYKPLAAGLCDLHLAARGWQPGPAPWPVNTLLLRENRLAGASTDGPGLVDALTAAGVALPGRTVLLLGAGGAAQAVAPDLLAAGVERLLLAHRRPEPAAALAARLGPSAHAVDLGDAALAAADLVLNATRLGHGGQAPQAGAAAWLEVLPWPAFRERGALVVDLVYADGPTFVQARALAHGLPADRRLLGEATAGTATGVLLGSGEAMLAAQAARSFALWTGRRVDADLLRRVLLP